MLKKLIAAISLAAIVAGCGGAASTTKSENTTPTPATQTTQPASMNHEHSLELKPTPGKGNQPLAFKQEGDVKVFNLEAKEVEWETYPGHKVKAWTWNGTVPGPQIRVTEGDKVRIIIKNSLTQATSLHPHGLTVPNAMDGVPGLGGAKAIQPGETQTMEFVAKPAGTHWYHSHVNSAEQVMKGLYGAFIVDPKQPQATKYDRDYTVMIGDGGDLGYVLNGKGFPSTEPLDVKEGEKIRLRFIGTGVMAHPMHLHGHMMKVIAREGAPLPAPYETDTVTVTPGESWDVEFTADNTGTWPLHCHILTHAENKDGMYGLTEVLRYQK